MKWVLYLIALFFCACFAPQHLNASGDLVGTVTDSVTGLPISGALVIVTNGNQQATTTTTNANGIYTVTNLKKGNFTVIVSKSGYQRQALGARINNNEITTVNFELVPIGGTIQGTVRDTALTPIPGASVEVFQGATLITTVITNVVGFYTVPDLASGSYIVNASATGFQTQSKGAEILPNVIRLVDFELPANPGSISGNISDSLTTNPIEGALVNVFDSDILVGFTKTDVNGNYSIPSLTPAFYTVVASADNFQTQAVGATVLSNVTTTVSLALDPLGGTIAGVVTDSSTGNPIPGASIQVFKDLTVIVSVLTDPNGTYSVTDISPGNYSVVANATNHQTKALGAIVLSNATTTVNFPLDPSPGTIVGNVTDAITTNPIAGASIQIFDGQTLIANSLTDPNGNYQVHNIAPGSYTVNATKVGYQTQSVGAIVASSATTTVNFALEINPGAIAGTVIDVLTTNPIAGATILVFRGRTFVASVLTDTNGNYTISNLTPGQYFVNASATNYQSAVQGATVVSNITTTANFALELNPGTISGTVTNAANGSAIPGASVRLFREQTLIKSTLTDPSGNYSLPGIAPGSYVVVVSASDFRASAVGAQVTPNATTIVNFALTPDPGTIVGTVTDFSTTNPIAGATVAIFSGPTFIDSTLTDSNGNYMIPGLAPGNYIIIADAVNFGAKRVGAIVASNTTTTVNLALDPSAGTITGTVTDFLTTNPISGAFVQIFSGSTLITIGLTDGNGDYTISGLSPGSYNVRASATDHQSQVLGAIVTSNTTTTVDFALVPNPGSITGKVTNAANGNPIPSTRILVFKNLVAIASTLTDPNGNYTIPGLAPGNYVVVADELNFSIAVVGASISSNQTTIVNFALTADPGAISGTVRNASNSNPIPNATIEVHNSFVLVATAITDANGNYTIPNIAPDAYTVIATATAFQDGSKSVIVNSNQTTTVDFSLSPSPGTISGRVTDFATTNPIPGATVAVFQGTTLIEFALTDANGNYVIPNLAAGNYVVLAIAKSYRAAFSVVTVTAGMTTTVNFALIANPGTIAGRIIEACSGGPVPGAVVLVSNGSQIVGFDLSDPNGNYSIPTLAPGSYTVTAAKRNFIVSSSPAIVASNATTIVNFSLIPAALPPASITGKVVKNKFLNKTERVKIIAWTASPGLCVTGYQIFRNGKQIAFVPASGKLEFKDCKSHKKADVYSVRAVNKFGLVSSEVTITLK